MDQPLDRPTTGAPGRDDFALRKAEDLAGNDNDRLSQGNRQWEQPVETASGNRPGPALALVAKGPDCSRTIITSRDKTQTSPLHRPRFFSPRCRCRRSRSPRSEIPSPALQCPVWTPPLPSRQPCHFGRVPADAIFSTYLATKANRTDFRLPNRQFARCCRGVEIFPPPHFLVRFCLASCVLLFC